MGDKLTLSRNHSQPPPRSRNHKNRKDQNNLQVTELAAKKARNSFKKIQQNPALKNINFTEL